MDLVAVGVKIDFVHDHDALSSNDQLHFTFIRAAIIIFYAVNGLLFIGAHILALAHFAVALQVFLDFRTLMSS